MYFTISVLLKYVLKIGAAFGEKSLIRGLPLVRWVILLYFTISVLLKSGLIRVAAFGEKSLIRGLPLVRWVIL